MTKKIVSVMAATVVAAGVAGPGSAAARPGCPSGCVPKPQISDGTSNTVLFGELTTRLMEEEGIFYLVAPHPITP
jgi:hypothetical protein